MKALIAYHSYGGNTKDLAEELANQLEKREQISSVDLISVRELNKTKNYEMLLNYDVLILGSNTWGDGDLPKPMAKVCNFLNDTRLDTTLQSKYTAVFGTGDTGYAHYCESVNQMAALFNGRSKLIVTLKVEQIYCESDMPRIENFADKINLRITQDTAYSTGLDNIG